MTTTAAADTAAHTLRPLAGPGVWRRADLGADQWRLALDDACRREIAALARELEAHPLDVTLLDPAEYALDACRAFMRRVKAVLDDGPGLCVVTGLPMDALDETGAKRAYWLLSNLIARPVAQSFDGRVLYDVRDTGQRIDTRVRGDLTSQELSWHTDYGFNHPPPYIGLLVLRTARAGGVSRVASLLNAHNRLLAEDPALLARLYEPFCWNRQGEHPEGDPAIHRLPIFERRDGDVRGRYIKWLLYKGYELAGEPFDDAGQAALERLFAVMSEEENHVCFELAAGQIQYMNNFRVAHCRTEYEDFDEPDRKRHLVRIFLRDEGRRSYMG